ncbi:hypothetical protein [Lysinibacter cavernae]|uniref:Cellobiose-specific phosphotransferase system component IIB n=1 Tax=Lysinibacter cavernae TaxID=1640652 RepID=A0A7X5R273_9MICO|nr:hypothetical protein [Lysinibacter cavernae]NIH54191.1 cellobiose-specific phosphotransferase system component IIB [Lysinibacter cavernae]
MRNITIVCGAGVSSTFLSHRVAAVGIERGLNLAVTASSLVGLRPQAEGDVILLGPHLAAEVHSLREQQPRATVVVLTEAILRALDGEAALALALGEQADSGEASTSLDSSTATEARSSAHG